MKVHPFFVGCRVVLILAIIFAFPKFLYSQELAPGTVVEIEFAEEALPKTLYSMVSGLSAFQGPFRAFQGPFRGPFRGQPFL